MTTSQGENLFANKSRYYLNDKFPESCTLYSFNNNSQTAEHLFTHFKMQLFADCLFVTHFYVSVPTYRHSKVRSLSSKGLQLSYKAYTNALTHISLSLQISVSSAVKSQLFCSCLKRYINNVSLRYSFSLMLTSYIIINIFVCWFLGLP